MNRNNLLSATFAALIALVAFGTSSAFAKDTTKLTSCCAMACCQPGASCCVSGASCCSGSCCGSGCCATGNKKKTVSATAKVKTVAKTAASVAPRR